MNCISNSCSSFPVGGRGVCEAGRALAVRSRSVQQWGRDQTEGSTPPGAPPADLLKLLLGKDFVWFVVFVFIYTIKNWLISSVVLQTDNTPHSWRNRKVLNSGCSVSTNNVVTFKVAFITLWIWSTVILMFTIFSVFINAILKYVKMKYCFLSPDLVPLVFLTVGCCVTIMWDSDLTLEHVLSVQRMGL